MLIMIDKKIFVLILSYHVNHALAAGFISDSTLNGIFYYSDISKLKKDLPDGNGYKLSMNHITSAISLNFQSGYYHDFIGMDLSYYHTQKILSRGRNTLDEIGISDSNTVWDEQWQGDRSGSSLYQAAMKLKYSNYWLNAGYIIPSGQTLIASNWNIVQGAYRGIELGFNKNVFSHDKFKISYFIADRYKAPWYAHFYSFRQVDKYTPISFIDSIGGSYEHDKWLFEGAYGRSRDYISQYLWKTTYSQHAENDKIFRLSYQLYMATDNVNNKSDNNLYDGVAWLQGMTLFYLNYPFEYRIEATQVKAAGSQGYFTTRLTPVYASSAGRMDFDWDSISDFNANGEKAVFFGVRYALDAQKLSGWSVGASYAFGWDVRPGSDPVYDQTKRIHESAVAVYLNYDLAKSGFFSGGKVKLRYVYYTNHSGMTGYSNGFNNTPQDQKNIKLTVTLPFSIIF
ncbi:OprD family outer membrane porin [Pantoea cypripedii]|nr:OprD family outer membrane porin [Pantoea cypripedii]MBP2199295.1 hypothetical protein [Pantoea cypripedii]